MKRNFLPLLAPAALAALLAGGPVLAAPPADVFVVAQADKPTGQGTLNSVDATARKLNITHGPVAALNWPGMTMNFGVTPGVDLTALKAGSKITFTLSRAADGMYVIDAIKADE